MSIEIQKAMSSAWEYDHKEVASRGRLDDAYELGFIAAWQARSSKTLGPENLEHVAKAIWDWEHDNRESKILDIEWSLLRSEYLCRAQVAIVAYNRGKI